MNKYPVLYEAGASPATTIILIGLFVVATLAVAFRPDTLSDGFIPELLHTVLDLAHSFLQSLAALSAAAKQKYSCVLIKNYLSVLKKAIKYVIISLIILCERGDGYVDGH